MKTYQCMSAVLTAAVVCLCPASLYAADCQLQVGKLASAQGTVEVIRGSSDEWKSIKVDELLCQGDTIRAGENSRATLALINNAVLRLGQNTTMRLVDITGKKEERSALELIKGIFQSFSRKPSHMSVDTPYLNGVIEGTEFVMQVEDGKTHLTVLEGKVIAQNEQGKLAVSGGKSVTANKGEAPQDRVLVNPRSEVQWALHYPGVFVEETSVSSSDINKAAKLLSVGQVKAAKDIIAKAIEADASNGQAYALRAIIAVVQNQNKQALADGKKAVELDNTSAGSIALSYAQQANFQIEAARNTLATAAAKHKEDALVLARLAELELMLGNRGEAINVARKAQQLAPNLARSQVVLGFTQLANFKDGQARASFEQAIKLNSAEPLAHLGRGLAMISEGELAKGRREIELAVALDGSSALLRAYLGKAYYEEKRGPLDEQQFDIAKQLDPNDPTAFLYSGISKQTNNRPVEALTDLEQSIALNDNRAVYRSRMLLDQDHAARGASLARAYNDLGFTDQGVAEATNSLTVDPANASAHRFLSDVYQTKRRHEIARVSELLQAQMLQPLNMNSIQPSSSETNLNITSAGGPAATGFNEFTPLFQRNQMQLSISNEAGSNETVNREAAVSGLYENVSFGLGALSYETDGWRPNNGLEQEVYNAFVQYSPTDRFSVQAEYTNRESTAGDLAFNFDPNDYVADKTIKRDTENSRLGLRYSLTPRSHLLVSYIHSEKEVNTHEVTILPPVVGVTTATEDSIADIEANQVELQFISSIDSTKLVAGINHNKQDQDDNLNLSIDDSVIGNLFSISAIENYDTKSTKAYLYANSHIGSTIWSYGVSLSNYELQTFEDDNVNPKFGLQWSINSDLKFRAAAFQVVKPVLSNNRTLEPTQIAGFNQLFDDINGTKSQRYSMGLDWKVAPMIKTGIEFTKRKLDEPVNDPITGFWITEGRDELLHKAYLDWTPHQRVAIHAELVYDEYNSDIGILTADDNLPEKVITRSVPVSINYFEPSGFYTGIGVTYVEQSVRRSATATQASGYDSFTVVDAVLGYRIPKQYGSLSLSVKNLFDKEFMYQDDSYREFRDEPSTGPYFPERMLMARLVINL